MYFHLNQDEFKNFVNKISERAELDEDIIEKDYFVCTVLKELSKKQEELKAYFKGGTAIYKILDKMNRFSEDIDLTVEFIETDSNNSNKMRLKRSAKYNIPELELQKEKTKDERKSITTFYKYNSLFNNISNPLHKPGEIQIEATSFTVSEPVELYKIEPIIYKYANDDERKKLKEYFDIDIFELKVQKLERIFVDKIFAAEFYFLREEYIDFSKHIYDISILLQEDRIKKLLENPEYFKQLVNYKRQEERIRIGGIDPNKKIVDFEYLMLTFNEQICEAYESMQNKYIFKSEYKLNIDTIKESLKTLKDKILDFHQKISFNDKKW